MMKKSFYEAPEAELLLVKFEENIMSGPGSGYNTNGNAGNELTEDSDYTYSF